MRRSIERVPFLRDRLLLRAFDVFLAGAESGEEVLRPLVRRFEDDALARPANDHLSLGFWKPNGFRQAHRLTPAVREDLRFLGHAKSIYARHHAGDSGLSSR